MKFVMTQALCKEGMALLENMASVYVANDRDPNHYLEQMADADALIVRIAKCDGHTIEHSPNLKVIGRPGIGYDSVDVKKATELGIPVVITPGANNRSVAEHTVAMIFAVAANLLEAHNEMSSGNWEIRDAGKAFELKGKTVGIIGLGPIGRETTVICLACGMKVIAYDSFFTKEQIEQTGAVCCEQLDTLLRDADIVSVHMPLVDATRNFITSRELSLMKKTAVIINCSRGGIINERDLVEALQTGAIAGAGVDVFCHEPPAADDPLLKCPNVVLSPHTAALTREATVRMAEMCVKGCLAVCGEKKWPHVADKSVYDHPRWAGKDWAET